jgi:hypothetical protein
MRRLVKVIGYVSAQRTCVVIPDWDNPLHPDQYLEYTRETKQVQSRFVRHAAFKMAARMAPLDHVLDVVDRELNTWETNAFLAALAKESGTHRYYVQKLKAWKRRLQGIQREKAARVIQHQFRKSMCDPSYRMCQKRLLKEYEDLVS